MLHWGKKLWYYRKQDVFVKHNTPDNGQYSNEGKDHKETYFDTSRKILSQEMTISNKEALVSDF
mgnify:CR=1 FL=1